MCARRLRRRLQGTCCSREHSGLLEQVALKPVVLECVWACLKVSSIGCLVACSRCCCTIGSGVKVVATPAAEANNALPA